MTGADYKTTLYRIIADAEKNAKTIAQCKKDLDTNEKKIEILRQKIQAHNRKVRLILASDPQSIPGG